MRKLLAVVAVLMVAGTQDLHAQGLPIALEVRGGFSIPTGEWNEDEELGNGVGFSGSVLIGATPTLAL